MQSLDVVGMIVFDKNVASISRERKKKKEGKKERKKERKKGRTNE